MITAFEKLVTDKMTECLTQSIEVDSNNVARHALIKGRYHGLKEALALFKQAARDIDADEV